MHKRWLVCFKWIAGALGTAGLCLYLQRHDPTRPPFLPRCLFHQCTGLYCPGCGAARAAHQFLQGHLLTAFSFNPLLPLLLAVLAWALWRAFCREVLNHPPQPARVPWWSWYLLTALIVLFTILRNVPAWPFSLLAP